MDRFLDTPIELLEQQVAANVIGPLVLNQAIVPTMVERGGGTIVNITSAVGVRRSRAQPAGEGGWGIGYGARRRHRTASPGSSLRSTGATASGASTSSPV